MAAPALKNPIFVALDVDTADHALQLAHALRGAVGGFKVGPRLVVRYGSSLIEKLSALGPVFIDLKFLDIPSTMESAIRASFHAGASFATIHAWSGEEAMKRLAHIEAELSQARAFQILAVTILTSFSQSSLPTALGSTPIATHVEQLALLAQRCGLTGVVSSAWELSMLNQKAPGLFKVVPGIRSATDQPDDQARTLTAHQALSQGAQALVIGRPIVQASNPRAAAEQILNSL